MKISKESSNISLAYTRIYCYCAEVLSIHQHFHVK